MDFKKIIIASFILLPSVSFAFFCPTNFTQIEFGMTMEQVLQQCGKPDKQESKMVKRDVPEEWSFFIPQTVSTSTMTAAQGTLKTQITFDSTGKAVNISVNGIGVGSSSICGSAIQLGDTKQTIKAACGKPSFINSQQTQNPTTGETEKVEADSDKFTTFFYNSNPPTKLIFINGNLAKKE